jgi:hypothetical protein
VESSYPREANTAKALAWARRPSASGGHICVGVETHAVIQQGGGLPPKILRNDETRTMLSMESVGNSRLGGGCYGP